MPSQNGSSDESSEMYFIGVEGGGTSSNAVLLNVDAKVLATSKAETTNMWNVGIPKTCETIMEMVNDLKQKAGFDNSVKITGIGLCLSGADAEKENKKLLETLDSEYHAAEHYVIEADTIGSLATALPDLSGIVLISGAYNFDGSERTVQKTVLFSVSDGGGRVTTVQRGGGVSSLAVW